MLLRHARLPKTGTTTPRPVTLRTRVERRSAQHNRSRGRALATLVLTASLAVSLTPADAASPPPIIGAVGDVASL